MVYRADPCKKSAGGGAGGGEFYVKNDSVIKTNDVMLKK